MTLHSKHLRIITALVSFLSGAVIYLLWRPSHLLGFRLLNVLGLSSWVDAMRLAVTSVRLPDFCVYCLPNGLWSLSYILMIHDTTSGYSASRRILWAGIIPCLGIVSECLQAITIVPGTFDWGDLLAYLLPWLIYVLLFSKVITHHSQSNQ